VTAGGSGYAIGDVVTIAASAMPGRSTAAKFILVADDIAAGAVVTTVDALLGSASTTAGEDLEETIDDSAIAVAAGSITTSGTGTGLELRYTSTTAAITSITAAGGSGYRVGDTITIAAAAARAVVTTIDALMGSASTTTGEDLTEDITAASSATAVLAASISTSGAGIGLELTYTSTATEITSITVTAGGSGYQVGDNVTIAADAMDGRSTAAKFTLQFDDLVPPAMPGRSTDAVFTLVEDDLSVHSVLTTTPNSLMGSASTTEGEDLEEPIDATMPIALTVGAVTCTRATASCGTATGLELKYSSDSTKITGITVIAGGTGYNVGDTITIVKGGLMPRAKNWQFKPVSLSLEAGDIIKLRYDNYIIGSEATANEGDVAMSYVAFDRKGDLILYGARHGNQVLQHSFVGRVHAPQPLYVDSERERERDRETERERKKEKRGRGGGGQADRQTEKSNDRLKT
jgi:hypothetical protein